jgi:hypothetical protein
MGHPVYGGFELAAVRDRELTKRVEAIRRAMRFCEAGWSNAYAGWRPTMRLIQAAWRVSTECSVATAATISRESSRTACHLRSAA